MAGNAARRARRQSLEDHGDDLDDDVDLDEEDDGPARPHLAARFLDWLNQDNKDGSSMRMQGRDATVAYAVSAVLVLIPFVFVVGNATHHGPALPSPVAQAVGLIFGLLTALSVRLANRVLTPLAAITSVLITGIQSTAIPKSLQALSEIDLVAGMAAVIYLTLRQSRARGVQTAERRSAQRQARDARRRGGSTRRQPVAEEPTGPPRSRRYTPPKNRSSA